jgi:hypothetical protein
MNDGGENVGKKITYSFMRRLFFSAIRSLLYRENVV